MEDIFGPIVGLLRESNAEHALELANDNQYGLWAVGFIGDLNGDVRFVRRIHSGMAHVNDIPVADAANAPFDRE
ncbi:aldehyde dehydrogenase family protein [Pseudomonas sp. zbq_4]|uniref:aldehyde dehydrogenase family protein n=1 Tax=Pseudomonas TaxID=286 RepID=UPI00370B1DE4